MKPSKIPVYSAREFKDLLLVNCDVLLHHPCIVEGFVTEWHAFNRWRSFDYLRQQFGSIYMNAGAPQFTTHTGAKICAVGTTYEKYLDYVQNPRLAKQIFSESWTKGNYDLWLDMGLPLYCGSVRFIWTGLESTMAQLQPLLPDPMNAWNSYIPLFYTLHNHVWLYVGLPKSLTPLHADNNAVMSYLGQLQGEKHVILYSPQDVEYYYNEKYGYLDPLKPNDSEYPNWRLARPWIGTLGEGQMLVWGPNWAHHVVTKEMSITVSLDFVNELNLRQYASSAEWAHDLGRRVWRKRQREGLISVSGGESKEDVVVPSPVDFTNLGREVLINHLRGSLKQLPGGTCEIVHKALLDTLLENHKEPSFRFKD